MCFLICILYFKSFGGHTFKNVLDVRKLALGCTLVCSACFEVLHVLFDFRKQQGLTQNLNRHVKSPKLWVRIPKDHPKSPKEDPNVGQGGFPTKKAATRFGDQPRIARLEMSVCMHCIPSTWSTFSKNLWSKIRSFLHDDNFHDLIVVLNLILTCLKVQITMVVFLYMMFL